jgi:NADH-quinone oxidoreductase subunit M
VPILAAVFLFIMMSSIGLPGLNGFVGEFLILIGTFITHRWWAVVGASGVILAAVYMLWAYQRVFHGEPTGDNATIKDMTWKERGAMVPIAAAIVFLGVYPKPVLDRINPSVNHLIAHVQAVDPSLHLPSNGVDKTQAAVATGGPDDVDSAGVVNATPAAATSASGTPAAIAANRGNR